KAVRGGAVYLNMGSTVSQNVRIDSTTFLNNEGVDLRDGTDYTVGGGLVAQGGYGRTLVTNSTFVGNSAKYGGALRAHVSAKLDIVNSTITGNHASWQGGGIIGVNNSQVTVQNSIVHGNTAVNWGPDFEFQTGVLQQAQSTHNLIGVNSSTRFAPATNPLIGADPLLGPLAENGGPTRTMAPGQGSAAIDAGDDSLASAAGLTTDQRGHLRVIDLDDESSTGNIDIGAFEVQPPPIEVVDFYASNEQLVLEYLLQGTAARPLTVNLFAGGSDQETLLQTIDITDPQLWAAGVTHTYAFTPDFSLTDVDEDYYLAVGISYEAGALTNSDSRTLASGLFVEADGTVHLHGTDADETVTVTATEITSAVLLAAPFSVVSGNSAEIRLHGGNDVLTVSSIDQAEFIGMGGEGNDQLTALQSPTALLDGGEGNDSLVGDLPTNLLSGSAGDDTLHIIGAGQDVSGGYGNDVYKFVMTAAPLAPPWNVSISEPYVSFAVADAGRFGGSDTLDFSGLEYGPSGVTINLGFASSGAQTVFSDGSGTAWINLDLQGAADRIENIVGTNKDDALTGDNNANRLDGLSGQNYLDGGWGNDVYAIGNQFDALTFNHIEDVGGVDFLDFSGWQGEVAPLNLLSDSIQKLTPTGVTPEVKLVLEKPYPIDVVIGVEATQGSLVGFTQNLVVTSLTDNSITAGQPDLYAPLDPQSLTLRDALAIANADSGPNQIEFSEYLITEIVGEIDLTHGSLGIYDRETTIIPPGMGELVVDQTSAAGARIFEIPQGASASISGMTLTGGDADKGGSVVVGGELSLDGVLLTGNQAE
ncbi:MAG: hypothetical protein KDA37_18100, partial [Planctomycetales bacterium]|nr:hypothetical protein [Planctomycetales bacterium]